jgi:hypothetical protein
MDYELLAREMVRSLRGHRSQVALSRRLGLQSNPVYRWEAGRAWPTAQQLFQVCRLNKPGALPKLEAFTRSLTLDELQTRGGIARFLRTLAADAPVQQLAQRLSVSRFVVSRWLVGKTEIRLPDLLHFVDKISLRLLDFLAALLDPELLPSTKMPWRRLSAARQAAYDAPWSHAILRAIELADYRKLRRPPSGWLARRLGISLAEERRCLKLLLQTGQLELREHHYFATHQATVDTAVDRERRLGLRTFWGRVAINRLANGTGGTFAFNLFSIAEKDFEKAQVLHREFFSRLQALVSDSEPSERVALYAAQLLTLDARS